MHRTIVVVLALVVPMMLACGGGGGGKRKRGNTPPTLTPIPTPQSASPGTTLAFQVTAADLESDPLVFSAAPLPANANFVDNGNGTGDFTFTPDVSQNGQSFGITFSVTDGNSPPRSQVVDIDVSSSGTGDFVEIFPPVTVGAGTWGMDAADVDADGFMDIIAADYGTSTGTGFVVLIGDGAGGFTATPESPYALPGASGSPIPRHVTVGDLNGDGVDDVVVLARGDGDIHVFLGDAPGGVADGTFTNYPGGYVDLLADEVHHGDIADLDGDGNEDLAVAAMTGGNLRVYLGDGAGGLTESAQSPYDISAGAGGIGHVVIGDVTGDGIPDLAAADFIDDVFTVLVGNNDGSGRNGNATFSQNTISSPTPAVSPGLPVLADFNGDTRLDVALPHFNTPANFTVWLGNGAGGFTEAAQRPAMGSTAEYGATGDFNGDGFADLAGSCASSADLWVFFGDGAGNFTGAAANPRPLSGSGRYVLATDFNGDGITDLAVTAQSAGSIHIFLGI